MTAPEPGPPAGTSAGEPRLTTIDKDPENTHIQQEHPSPLISEGVLGPGASICSTDVGVVPREDSTVKFSDELRHAIRTAGITRYRLAKNTGCSQQLLSAFMTGKSGLSMATIDTITRELGLHLVAADRADGRRSPSRGGR